MKNTQKIVDNKIRSPLPLKTAVQIVAGRHATHGTADMTPSRHGARRPPRRHFWCKCSPNCCKSLYLLLTIQRAGTTPARTSMTTSPTYFI